ncbi:ribonuclease H [Trifolium pratense]|uniref:Ribonuclease H n=1 Tax=Trifolium pratense TaxID=57577 RepID=A0A2K3N669_TRIPR|nr:ribonuclease H [Trifolium pratense]
MLNGMERAYYFPPQRGIHQGYPISPYLFVLCIDKLSHLISHVVNVGEWNVLRAGRGGPIVSFDVCGLFVVWWGNRSSDGVCAEDFGPVLQNVWSGTPKRVDCNYLLEHVSAKLTVWKANHLSFAGLAKSVLEAIPTFPMMTTRLLAWRKRNEVQNGVLAKQSDSNLWKAIVNLWPKLDDIDNSFWSIRDGRSIAFCHQKWINTDIRISELNIHIPELIWNAKVSDLVDDRGRWNWELLNGWLPESILHQIAAVPPPDDSAGPDQCICIGLESSAGRLGQAKHSGWEVLQIFAVELNVDSRAVVNAIHGEGGDNLQGSALVHKIRRLLERDWEVVCIIRIVKPINALMF